jgi:phage replication-related protein YjqB (UPF0714/DUF867 family)
MAECLSFSEFKGVYTKNVDYIIESRITSSGVLVAAPHGGLIEPSTTEAARIIAADKFNFYSLTSFHEDPNMHITSHLFDEPTCLRLAKKCQLVLTIHGCVGDTKAVYVGGLHFLNRIRIANSISKIKGIDVYATKHKYAGEHPDNICNKSSINKGVQVELTRSLRDDKKSLHKVVKAIHSTLLSI